MAKESNFATVADALAGAGTTVLSSLADAPGGGPSFVNEKLRKELLAQAAKTVEGEHRVYIGPYTDQADQRNSWTAYQDEGSGGARAGTAPPERAQTNAKTTK